MAQPRRKYRPPEPGPLQLRESVRRPLLALAGPGAPDAHLEASLVEDVERVLRCELPDEVLACFANGDDTLPEWGFRLGDVADHTARELGCRPDLIAVGRHPDSHVLYCVGRRGDRCRPVGLVEFEAEGNGDTTWRDLGAWLAERAGLEPDSCSPQAGASVRLALFEDICPAVEPVARVWRLVG